MSVSTLANTKWLLNSNIQFDPQYPFQGANVNFVSNSTLYSYLDVTDDHYSEISYGTSAISTTLVYTDDAWVNNAYRTIYFIDGADIDDSSVIDWVENSGTQIDVDIELVNADWLNSSLIGVANTIRTKGGTSASLAFPSGFVSAVNDIPSGGGSSYPALVGIMTSTYNSTLTAEVNFDTTIDNGYCVDEDGNAFNGTNGAFQYRIWNSATPNPWTTLSQGTTTINPGSGSHTVEFRFINTTTNKPFGMMWFQGIPDYLNKITVTNNKSNSDFLPLFATRNFPTYDTAYANYEGFPLMSDLYVTVINNNIYTATWQISGEED